jgi:hypothetical protein
VLFYAVQYFETMRVLGVNFLICERFGAWQVRIMTEEQRKFFRRALKDGLRIQGRFSAEPVLARTGKGYLKSEGVTTLERIKTNLKKSKPNK